MSDAAVEPISPEPAAPVPAPAPAPSEVVADTAADAIAASERAEVVVASGDAPLEASDVSGADAVAPVDAPSGASEVAASADAVIEAPVDAPSGASEVAASADAVIEAPVEPVEAADAVLEAPVEPVEAADAVVEAPAEPGDAPVEVRAEDASLTYANGDIVPGTVTRVIGDGIDVDLGLDRVGVIPRSEVVGEDPAVGDPIEGTVIRRQGGTGRYVLSPKRAVRERLWAILAEKFHAGDAITVKVTGTTKGGLVIDAGVRGFLPDSLTDTRKSFPSASLIGQDILVKIVEVERARERLVVNRKALVEVERREKRTQLMGEVAPGQRRTGRVTTLLPFGCFVDIGGAEGLVHVSELAHRNVAKVEEEVRVGDEIEVIVLTVDHVKGKIGLSRKAAMANPWDAFISEHKVGDLVYGTVSGLAPFGVFVTLEGENFGRIEGLVHISELSRFRVETPADVVAEGEGVWVKILSIDGEKRRLSLSLRRALDGD